MLRVREHHDQACIPGLLAQCMGRDEHVTEDKTIIGPGWFDAETATFGDRMAGAREAARLDQAGLAKRLGVTLKTVRAWEEDQSEPRANKLQMLAGLLGVSMMWLLTGEGDGLQSPVTAESDETDVDSLLIEMRALRTSQLQIAEQIGKLEKRLRRALVVTEE